jgi:hypothetical protein
MKRILLISFILAGTLGNYNGIAQGVPVYPIPSYNVLVDGNATFREDVHKPGFSKSKQKRAMHIRVKPKGGTQLCQATVWVYSLDQSTILGPFTVNCGETLAVEIDDREWGVLAESEEEILVDVWITTGGKGETAASNKGETICKGEAAPRPNQDNY